MTCFHSLGNLRGIFLLEKNLEILWPWRHFRGSTAHTKLLIAKCKDAPILFFSTCTQIQKDASILLKHWDYFTSLTFNFQAGGAGVMSGVLGYFYDALQKGWWTLLRQRWSLHQGSHFYFVTCSILKNQSCISFYSLYLAGNTQR